MSAVSVELQDSYSASMQDLLSRLGNDPEIRKRYNEIIGNAINQFVPMKSGALRISMRFDAESVHWGESLPYAHYQYAGIVWGPNFPQRNEDGTIIGWRSPIGVGSKHPTDRLLGATPGEYDGWVFGYSEPGTMAHWDAPYTGHQWAQYRAGEPMIKADVNLKIYREVVQPECKKLK